MSDTPTCKYGPITTTSEERARAPKTSSPVTIQPYQSRSEYLEMMYGFAPLNPSPSGPKQKQKTLRKSRNTGRPGGAK